MSKSPDEARLRQENDRPPPQQSAAAEATASRAPQQKTNSSAKEAYLTKAFGFPFRSLLRDPVDPISPPPPTDEARQAPPSNSPHRSLKENSLDSALQSPVRRSENQVTVPIPQTNREASFPVSPLRSLQRGADNTSPPASQQPLSTQNDNASKSPGRDETAVITHCQSVLEDAGSPMLQMDGSPENPVVTNRMAASPAATMAAKVGRGGVNGKRVESGVLRRPATRKAEFGLRVLEVILCMISFSVMAADKTSGWAGDSFDRYQEFRFVLICALGLFGPA